MKRKPCTTMKSVITASDTLFYGNRTIDGLLMDASSAFLCFVGFRNELQGLILMSGDDGSVIHNCHTLRN